MPRIAPGKPRLAAPIARHIRCAGGTISVKLLYVEDNAEAAADLSALLARHGSQVIWEMRCRRRAWRRAR
jgi:hypothetical protein